MDNICITTTANAFSTATTPTTLQLYCIFFYFLGVHALETYSLL